MVRIVRNGGLIAIGVEYSTMTEEDGIALAGYAIHEKEYVPKRINSVGEILQLFGERVDTVFLNHDAPMRRSHTRGGMIEDVSKVTVIFSIQKQ
jgi:hypothetical protein